MRLVEPGDDVLFSDERASFFRNGAPVATVSLHEAQEVDLRLSGPLPDTALAHLARSLACADVGFGVGLEPDENLRRVLRQLSESTTDGWPAAVRWLLGRGPGLTPSGDDILCGFGVGLLVRGEAGAHEVLCTSMRDARRVRRTTYVSEAYLDAMAEGYANEGVLDLLRAAGEGDALGGFIARVRDYGHTSGCDTLLGLALALGRGRSAPEGDVRMGWGLVQGAGVRRGTPAVSFERIGVTGRSAGGSPAPRP